jgi:hypothetical protein
MFGAIFAFRAYNTGSLELPSRSNKVGYYWRMTISFLVPRDRSVYQMIDQKLILKRRNNKVEDIQNELIDEIGNRVIETNYGLNNQKADRINKAYILTILGVFSLVLLTFIIGLIGVGLV